MSVNVYSLVYSSLCTM